MRVGSPEPGGAVANATSSGGLLGVFRDGFNTCGQQEGGQVCGQGEGKEDNLWGAEVMGGEAGRGVGTQGIEDLRRVRSGVVLNG